jgi:hypothetical protein
VKLRLAVTLAAGLAMLAACSLRPAPSAPAQPAATSAVPQPAIAAATAAATAAAVPPPTRTAPPPSAAPSLTASPVLSATPTLVPTPDPNQGVGDAVYTDQFDGKSGWYWNYVENDVVAFSPAGGKLNAVMKVSTAGARVTGGKPGLKVGDQQLRVTADTNLCYAKDEYGVMFRVNPDATDGYLFKLSCEGKAQVDVLHNYKPTVLVDWTASPAIGAGAPAQNTLMVWAAGDQFNFYVNDKYLFSASDKTFADGTYGFYIYDRTSGGASVSFSQMTVRAVKAGP